MAQHDFAADFLDLDSLLFSWIRLASVAGDAVIWARTDERVRERLVRGATSSHLVHREWIQCAQMVAVHSRHLAVQTSTRRESV